MKHQEGRARRAFSDQAKIQTTEIYYELGKEKALQCFSYTKADWWLRLSACRELGGISYDLCKDYQCRFDELQKDMEELLGCLNDNDVKRYDKQRRKKKRELRSKFKEED